MANDILVKVGADITDFSRKMSESHKALRDFGKANEETFDSFKKVGGAITGAGVALAGGLGFAVKTAADFESAMSNVKAISGATGEEFGSLREKAIEMGNSTMFSASESADAMANLEQMGRETDQILGGIEHTLSLAAAGGLELADAAMIMANTMNQFNIDASEAGRVSDVMAYAAASAGTDVTQMGDAMQYAGANAAAAGLSIEDTAAFIGILGDAGITGSKAGTSFNAMLRDLKKNSEEGALAVGEQSIALYDAEGNMRNMPTVIGEIIKATETMSGEQRDAALSAIMGDQALVGFNAIASKGADSVAGLADELYDSKGAAGDMADTMQDNLNGALTELSSAFEGVQIALGSALIPAVQKVTEWLTKLADWFNGLSDSTKTTIAIITAVAAALALVVGPILLLIGFIPSIIAGFTALGTVLGVLFSPVTLIIGAIIAIGAALVLAYNKVEWFRDGVDAVWQWIKETTETVFNAVKDVINSVLDFVMGLWDEYGERILSLVFNVWESIQNAIDEVMFYIKYIISVVLEEIAEFWENHGEAIVNKLKEIWESIETIVSTAIEIVKTVISTTLDVIITIFETAWNIISNVVKVVWGVIQTVVESALDLIFGIINVVMSLLQKDWEGAWNKIKDTADRILHNIVRFFKNIDLFKIGKDIILGLINGIKSMVSAVTDAVKNVASKITGGFKKILGIKSPSRVLMALGRDTGEGLVLGLSGMESDVSKAADGLAAAATPEIDMSYATPDGIHTSLRSAVNGTVDVNSRDDMITQAIDNLGRKLENMRIEMDRREFGRFVNEEITDGRSVSIRGGGRRRI